MFSYRNKRTYEDFKEEIPNMIQPLFESIREFCISLGENVVEDVRMHRIVFGKSITFRWFADIEPQNDGIIIKIQKNRKEPPQIVNVKLDQEITELKKILRKSYETIH
ncbi:hypothetical protein LCGC14_2083380 [marine sediment metagenome]|jgi:hypothetical protein|uniref:DUF5655 domain-containing protein n=1 Tax=marine sediment metagenome TaxID=412755 RepID=A0A0F9GT79_9ZZZZ